VLTRSEVARRLNRSIATVRRLENLVLHPIRGRNGVRLFDPLEVEILVREPSRMAPFCRSSWFERNRGNWAMPRTRHGGQTHLKQRKKADVAPDVNRQRVAAAEQLEAVVEVLLDAAPRQLLAVGVDDRALGVLLAAVDALRAP
jgi:hypothetical protein